MHSKLPVVLSLVVLMFSELAVTLTAQPNRVWEMQSSGCTASFRGLSIVDDLVVWASGSAGTVVKTLDAGETWQVVPIGGAEELDFRDIHAFSDSTAVVVSAGTPSRIYRTETAGESWKLVFEHENQTAFFDALAFHENWGIAFSDPIDDRLELVISEDGGKTWSILPVEQKPTCWPGEAGFAASGSCLQLHDGKIWIGLGGKHEENQARVFYAEIDRLDVWHKVPTSIGSNESSGIFSLAFANADHAVAIGGNYLEADNTDDNVSISDNRGVSWRGISGDPPSGYRSAIAFFSTDNGNPIGVCVGPNGTDMTFDFGESWRRVSSVGFHALGFSPTGKSGWGVGSEGRIGKIRIDQLLQ